MKRPDAEFADYKMGYTREEEMINLDWSDHPLINGNDIDGWDNEEEYEPTAADLAELANWLDDRDADRFANDVEPF